MAQAKQRGEYPANWKEIAKAVKDAAGWRCVRCLHAHCVESGHVLTVHHFDGNKANCERYNLMPLCQRCHLSVQARVDPSNPLLFPPSPWAMPYIAGLYEASDLCTTIFYHLDLWIDHYEKWSGEKWPDWAPRETKHKRPTESEVFGACGASFPGQGLSCCNGSESPNRKTLNGD